MEPGSPWENGYKESFNEKLRDELLNGEIFYTLKEAKILIERWRQEYNTVRPHSALGYRLPAPEAIEAIHRDPGYAMLRQDLWLDLHPARFISSYLLILGLAHVGRRPRYSITWYKYFK
jgi:hypothetical protein